MSYRFSFPKEMRAYAPGDNRALLGIAYDGPGGRSEFFGSCDDRAATLAVMVVTRLFEGMAFDDAVAEAKKRAAEFDAKREAKTHA